MGQNKDSFSVALDSIYEAALDPASWPRALDAVAHALGGNGASIVSMRGEGDVNMRISTSPVDTAARDSYNQHYGILDNVLARLSRAEIGKPLGCYDLVDRSDLLESEFYADWLRRIDLGDGIFFVLDRDGPAFTSFQIGGPLGAYPFATKERIHLTQDLSFHVRRALAINGRVAMTDPAFLEFSRADHLQLPVALFGSNGRILHCSETFVTTLERVRIGVSGGRIVTPTFAMRSEIERALDAALRPELRVGASIALEQPDGGELLLHFVPIRESILCVSWPAARVLMILECRVRNAMSGDRLRQRYGLTEAETAVAQSLAQRPGGLRTVADSLGIAPSTVKTHLQRIFEKTGTHRQAELVQLLLSVSDGAELERRIRMPFS